MVNKALQNDSIWDSKWKILFERYQFDLRHGYYIASILNNDIDSILEIGAGSYRDSALLARLGKKIGAFDFSLEACNLAKKKYPTLQQFFWQDNAFNTCLKDSAFDASFSNGFIGLFDDLQIENLIKEQIRITKKLLIITLHNGHNQGFQKYFKQQAESDNLYEIRFFKLEDIKNIFTKFSLNYKIYPVGKAYKDHEDILIQNKASLSEIKDCIFSQGMNFLETSERLMVVCDLFNPMSNT